MKKLSQKITYWLGVVAIGLVVGLSLQFVRAWTEPSVAPPGGNVGAPINTSNLGQTKIGGLILNTGGAVNGLIVQNGNVGISTTSPTTKLDINGGLRVRTLTTCSNATTGKLYADASGNVLCGTDQSSAGGGLTGSGTTNYVSKWTGATSLGNSQIYDNGSNVGIGTVSPSQKLEVSGNMKVNGLYFGLNSGAPSGVPGFVSSGITTGVRTDNFNVINTSGSGYTNVWANDYYIGATGKWASQLGGGKPTSSYTNNCSGNNCAVYCNGSDIRTGCSCWTSGTDWNDEQHHRCTPTGSNGCTVDSPYGNREKRAYVYCLSF